MPSTEETLPDSPVTSHRIRDVRRNIDDSTGVCGVELLLTATAMEIIAVFASVTTEHCYITNMHFTLHTSKTSAKYHIMPLLSSDT